MIEAFSKGTQEHVGPVDAGSFTKDAVEALLTQARRFMHAAALAGALALSHMAPAHAGQPDAGPQLAQTQDEELAQMMIQRSVLGIPFLSSVTVAEKYLTEMKGTETLSADERAQLELALRSVHSFHAEYEGVLKRMARHYRSKDMIEKAVEVERSIGKIETVVNALTRDINAKLNSEKK